MSLIKMSSFLPKKYLSGSEYLIGIDSKNVKIKLADLKFYFGVGLNFGFKGIANPGDNPGVQTESGFWVTTAAGTYTNFGGVVVNPSSLAVIVYEAGVYTINQTTINMTDYATNAALATALANLALPNMNLFGVQSPVVGTSASTPLTYIFDKPTGKGILKKLHVYTSGAGTIKLKRFRKSVDGLTFLFQDEISVAVTSGLNSIDIVGGMTFAATDYFGFYTSLSIRLVVGAGTMSYYYNGSNTDISVDTLISSLSIANTVKIQIGIELLNVDWFTDVKAQVDANTAVAATVTSLFVPFSFGVVTPVDGVTSQQGLTYIFDQVIDAGAQLRDIYFWSDVVTTVKIKRIGKIGSVYTFKEEISISTVIGVNHYTLPVTMNFEANDLIAIFCAVTGGFNHTTSGSVYSPFKYYSGDLLGSTATVAASSNQRIQIRFEFLVVKINTGGDVAPTAPALTGNVVLDENFQNNLMPSTMEVTGAAFTFVNHFAIPGGLGLANSIQGLIATNFNNTATRGTFVFTTASDRIGIFNRNVTFNQSASIVDVDIATNKISVYNNWTGTNVLPSINQDKVIAFTLIQNRPYRIDILKNKKDMQYVITDMVTGATDSITVVGGTIGIGATGYAFGKPGMFAMAGSPKISRIQYVIRGVGNPKILFEGDSITEAYLILADDCYSYRAVNALNGNGYVSAQSSCTPDDVIERLNFEILVFKPQYIHVLIGTNSSNMATWSASINQIHDLIKAQGIIPIFGCLPANIQNTSQVTTWNADLLAKGYRTVRYDLATTVNNDGINIDNSLFVGDQRHPNAAGGLAMFNRLKLDVPELFETV